MLPTDKKDFDHCMVRCFQNYRAAIDDGLLDEWFEEFRSFNFFHVRNAFKIYLRENEKYPPTLAAILRFAKRAAGEHRTKAMSQRQSKCYVQNCMAPEVEECWTDPAILICRYHMEEMILKTHPNSIDANIIKDSREFEAKAKSLGISNEEHFRRVHPHWYKIIVNPEEVT